MTKSIKDKFGKRIRDLRKQKGWSQEELADKVDLHRTYIGAIERGEQSVSIDKIEALAKGFRISVEELLRGF